MASAKIPLTCQHGTKFLAYRNKWTQMISNAASSPLRLITPRTFPHHHRPHHPLPLCSLLLLPRPPLPPLLRPRSPHLRPSRTLMSAASESPQSSTKTVRVVIKGRVQGVFYRNWTIENATELGLKGWVRNRRDGSVETLLSGNSDAVQEMEQRCRRGPPLAMVTRIEVHPSTDDPGSGFERRQTVYNWSRLARQWPEEEAVGLVYPVICTKCFSTPFFLAKKWAPPGSRSQYGLERVQ